MSVNAEAIVKFGNSNKAYIVLGKDDEGKVILYSEDGEVKRNVNANKLGLHKNYQSFGPKERKPWFNAGVANAGSAAAAGGSRKTRSTRRKHRKNRKTRRHH